MAVGGEEGAHHGVRVSVEVGWGGGFVVAAQHRLIERDRHDQPVEVCGCEAWIVQLQHAPLGEALKGGGQRGDRTFEVGSLASLTVLMTRPRPDSSTRKEF